MRVLKQADECMLFGVVKRIENSSHFNVVYELHKVTCTLSIGVALITHVRNENSTHSREVP